MMHVDLIQGDALTIACETASVSVMMHDGWIVDSLILPDPSLSRLWYPSRATPSVRRR
jgi:hypothetical protein